MNEKREKRGEKKYERETKNEKVVKTCIIIITFISNEINH